MVCDKCDHQAHWYYTVVLPHQAPGVSGKRYWCPSCAAGVPSASKSRAPTLEEHLQEKLNESWREIRTLTRKSRAWRVALADKEKDSKVQEQALANHVKENRRLMEVLDQTRSKLRLARRKVKYWEDKASWGMGSYHSMLGQQAQYDAMLRAQIQQARMSVRPPMIFPSGGLGCYAPGTELISKKNHEAIVDSLNEQLKAQQENFEKQEGKLDTLRERIILWRKCDIKDRCPACDHEMEKILEETK